MPPPIHMRKGGWVGEGISSVWEEQHLLPPEILPRSSRPPKGHADRLGSNGGPLEPIIIIGGSRDPLG